jgi:hypothetical protein
VTCTSDPCKDKKKYDSEKSSSWARPKGLKGKNLEILGVKGKFSTDQLYFGPLGDLSGEIITFGEATVIEPGFLADYAQFSPQSNPHPNLSPILSPMPYDGVMGLGLGGMDLEVPNGISEFIKKDILWNQGFGIDITERTKNSQWWEDGNLLVGRWHEAWLGKHKASHWKFDSASKDFWAVQIGNMKWLGKIWDAEDQILALVDLSTDAILMDQKLIVYLGLNKSHPCIVDDDKLFYLTIDGHEFGISPGFFLKAAGFDGDARICLPNV